MKRRSFMAFATAAIVAGSPAAAQQLSLEQVSQYLNQLQTAQGGFTQINADSTLSTGQIYIKRPGRIRFEYNAPDNSLVMAGGGSVAIFDPRSNNGPDRYPLNQTPLKIILERNVDLGRARMVTGRRTTRVYTKLSRGTRRALDSKTNRPSHNMRSWRLSFQRRVSTMFRPRRFLR